MVSFAHTISSCELTYFTIVKQSFADIEFRTGDETTDVGSSEDVRRRFLASGLIAKHDL